jgi:hypothetical protein
MKKLTSMARLACAGALVMAASGCGAAATAPAAGKQPAAAGPASATWKELEAALAGASACDTAQQCRTVGIGHKACGGPERYAAYSTKGGNEAAIRLLAQQYADARRREGEREGRMSTCSVTPDPGAACAARRCVLGPPGNGPAAY